MTGLNSQFYLFGGLGKNSHHGGRDARGVGLSLREQTDVVSPVF